MRKTVAITIGMLTCVLAGGAWAQLPTPVGLWDFNDAGDLTKATIGNNLQRTGTDAAAVGVSGSDGATTIGVGSYYSVMPGLAANGGGPAVSEWTLVFDFKVPAIGPWYAFFQTDITNASDADCFVRNPSGTIGVGDTGYSTATISANTWYRLVIAADLGTSYKYYLDGTLIRSATNLGNIGPATRFAIIPAGGIGGYSEGLIFFGDNDGEDGEITSSLIALYNVTFNADQAAALGVAGAPLTGGVEGPTAAFHVIPAELSGIQPLTVHFLDDSTAPVGQTITGRAWTFGDGGESSDTNPVHIYTDLGTFTVALTVTTDLATSDTETKLGYITVEPRVFRASINTNSTDYYNYPENTVLELTADVTGATCDPPGSDCVQYQWYKNGKEVGNEIGGATDAVFNFFGHLLTDAADTGDYYCKVTDDSKGETWATFGGHDHITVHVVAAEDMPVAGLLGLGLLAGAFAVRSRFVILKRK